MVIIGIVTLLFTNVSKAQNLSPDLISDAKSELTNRKYDLMLGREQFQSRIDNLRDSSDSNDKLNKGRIDALLSGIRDIDSTIKRIDIALDVIDHSGVSVWYSNRVELNRNGNSVKIYRRNSDHSVMVEVNNRPVLNDNNKDSYKDDISPFHSGGRKYKDFHGHLSGIFLGINGLLNKDGKYEAPDNMPFFELNESRSLDFSIYFNDLAVPFSKNFGLVIGTALQFNHYSFTQNFDLVVIDHIVTADYDHTVSDNFKRFNYRIMHFNVHMVFEFSTTGHRKFFVNAGVMGGIRIGSRTKQIYKIDGDRQKNTVRKPFDTNLFKYSFIGGVGFRDIQVFGEFSPVPLFKSGHAQEMYPFSLGIKWGF